MPCAWEHIYRCQLAADGDAALPQHCEVTCEGLRVAGHIDERAGVCGELCEAVDQLRRAARARRVYDDNIVLPRLGVACGSCLYVGDHPVNDVQGAQAAGMHPVFINAYGQKAPVPNVPEIRSLTELLDLVE